MAALEQDIINQLHDIYSTIHVPFWQTSTFYKVLCIVGVIIVAMLGWYAVRRWRSQRKAQHVWDNALAQLHQLQIRGLVCPEHAQLFYVALTRLIKEYMGQRFGGSWVGKTDEEFRLYITTISIPDDIKKQLDDIFDGIVVIKFAQAEAAQVRMNRDFAAGKAFVQATIPKKQ